jgi:hypothetical protein
MVDYLRELSRSFTAAVIMYVAVYLTREFVYGSPADWFYLLQLVAVGIVVYITAMVCIDRQSLRETVDLLRA